ncbi:NAD(P)-binding protein [Suillus ampliporus]|nr:NAD(P)-binding protein [Suillus ampliporus]
MTDSAPPGLTNHPRVALVTGAAQGIGRAIALRLAEDGLNIAVADLKAQRTKLDGVADEVRANGRRCIVLECDVSQEDEVQRMVQATENEFDGLDVMVANAGQFISKSMVDCTLTDFGKVFDTNVRGTFLCFRAAAQVMIKRGRGGRIISASSAYTSKGVALSSAYNASKAAIQSLSQTLASELGPHGITVNSYAPGVVDTPSCMFFPLVYALCQALKRKFAAQSFAEDMAKKVGLPDGKTFIQGYQAQIPLARIATPEDVANAVSFLSSKDAAYITGQIVVINGGA